MKYKLLYSPAAAADLEEINEYIAGELCSPAAARNVIGGILDAAEKLEDFPNMGTPLRAVTDMESDYRFIAVRGYTLFYRSFGDCVYIDRILHGRRDYMRILFDVGEQAETSRLCLYSGTASQTAEPSSQGNSGQKPQCGIWFSSAHSRIAHSAQFTLLTPGARQPVQRSREGRMKEPCPALSRCAAILASASLSRRTVARRASQPSQSIPQQPVFAIIPSPPRARRR